jgi:hypothetical protein
MYLKWWRPIWRPELTCFNLQSGLGRRSHIQPTIAGVISPFPCFDTPRAVSPNLGRQKRGDEWTIKYRWKNECLSTEMSSVRPFLRASCSI